MRWLVEFIFPRRLHRIAYWLRALSVEGAVYILCGMGGGTVYSSRYFLGAIIALIVYQLFFICLPRARDLEMNGWWLLFLFVPGLSDALGIILLLRAPVFLHLQGEPIRGGEQPEDLSALAIDQNYSWLSSPQK
jgi:uncharacterized membrane protein YhaH (DUF805 family)